MKRKLAIFDFDGTVYPGRSLPFLCLEFKNFSRSRFRYYHIIASFGALYLLYKMGILAGERSKERALVKFINLFREEPKDRIIEFFARVYRNMKKRFCTEVVNEARTLKAKGYTLVLISGACQPLLENVAAELGFDVVIGTNVPVKAGKFDSNGEIVYISGPRKVPALLNVLKPSEVDFQNSYAFADSYSDLAVLELVGHPVAVRPDRHLHQVARAKGWRIIGEPKK